MPETAKFVYPKNYGKFLDVIEILDKAIRAGGLKLTFESPGKVTHWIQRAYNIRKSIRSVNEGRSGWDRLTFVVDRNERRQPCSNELVIKFGEEGPRVEYLDPEFAAEMGLAPINNDASEPEEDVV